MKTLKTVKLFLAMPLLLLPLSGVADERPTWSDIVTSVEDVVPTILKNFKFVSVTKKTSLFIVEVNTSVQNWPIYAAGGRKTGSNHRITKPKKDGFILRIDYKGNANNVRRTSKEDREHYTLYETKVVLAQENAKESTDVRASAVFIRYEYGKELDDAWRKRLEKLIQQIELLDVKKK